VPPRKRKRKTAGPRIAPLAPMPMVQPLSDSDWQPFLELLPCPYRKPKTADGCESADTRSP
jgi:hypothetical protein